MLFQKNTQYTLRIFIYLAQQKGKTCSVQEMHGVLKIPYKYMTKLMSKNLLSGLLNVTQGKNGGYALARPADQISIFEIVQIHEDLEALDACLMGQNAVCQSPGCPMHQLWSKQRMQIKNFLHKKTLNALAAKQEKVSG